MLTGRQVRHLSSCRLTYCVCKPVNCAKLNHRDPTHSHDYVDTGLKCVMTVQPGKVHGGGTNIERLNLWRLLYVKGLCFTVLCLISWWCFLCACGPVISGIGLIGFTFTQRVLYCFKSNPYAVFHPELLILSGVGSTGNVSKAFWKWVIIRNVHLQS